MKPVNKFSAIFRHLAMRLMINADFFARFDIDEFAFYALLGIYMTCESTGRRKVMIHRVKNFTTKYVFDFKRGMYKHSLNLLHEKGYIWLGTTSSLTLTKLGVSVIEKANNVILNWSHDYISPIVSGITNGVVSDLGDITFPKPEKWRDPYNPYVGVALVDKGQYKAFYRDPVTFNEVTIGYYPTPIRAAKARDRFLYENGLFKHKRSLKHKTK